MVDGNTEVLLHLPSFSLSALAGVRKAGRSTGPFRRGGRPEYTSGDLSDPEVQAPISPGPWGSGAGQNVPEIQGCLGGIQSPPLRAFPPPPGGHTTIFMTAGSKMEQRASIPFQEKM